MQDVLHFSAMAQPAPQRQLQTEAPPLDPTAIDQAYRFYRAQRYARRQRQRATRIAHLRYWAALALLLLGCLVLAVTVWAEVRQLFGL